MRRVEPPLLALRILEHLTPGGCDESLQGDLLEEFRGGRSVAWYWRQVGSVIVLATLKDFRRHWMVVAFAALWSIPSPLVLITWIWLQRHVDFQWNIWQLDWPYSTICSLTLEAIPYLTYLWIGVAIYLFPYLWMTRQVSSWRMMSGLLAGTVALVALSLGFVTVMRYWMIHGDAHAQLRVFSVVRPTMKDVILNPVNLLECMPYFLGLILAIRISISGKRWQEKVITA